MLYIRTFGFFDIRLDEQSLLEEGAISYKSSKLLEYLLTFRGKRLLPESIIENLWQDNEYSDPRNVLRLQIFRLRKTLNKVLPDEIDASKYFDIKFINGYYCLKLGERVILDAEEFENCIDEADNKKPDEIIKLYKKALKMYKGPYLGENAYEMWLVPIRNYYNRLYIKTLFKLLDILKEKGDYDSVIELCEDAIMIEPYEETIHIYLLESMLKTGFIKEAMSHYRYITSLLDEELGVCPSPRLRNIYRKIYNYYGEKKENAVEDIKKRLDDDNFEGALSCDSDTFKVLLNLQRRKELREGASDFMSLITLDFKYTNDASEKNIKNAVKIMANVLEKSLRKGDVFSIWNDTQIVAILHRAKEDSLQKIGDRIRKNFYGIEETDKYKVTIKFLPITSKKNAM